LGHSYKVLDEVNTFIDKHVLSSINITFSTLQQAEPLLDERNLNELVDPGLGSTYNVSQMQAMISAAALCVQRRPQQRPKISQVSFFPKNTYLHWKNLDLMH
jgi:hypothetical protein